MQSTGCGLVAAVYIAHNGLMCEVKILVRVQASTWYGSTSSWRQSVHTTKQKQDSKKKQAFHHQMPPSSAQRLQLRETQDNHAGKVGHVVGIQLVYSSLAGHMLSKESHTHTSSSSSAGQTSSPPSQPAARAS